MHGAASPAVVARRTRAPARGKFTCNRNAIIRKSGASEFRHPKKRVLKLVSSLRSCPVVREERDWCSIEIIFIIIGEREEAADAQINE